MQKATVSVDHFEYTPPTKDLVTPCGMKVKIREQNGEDEDTISNIADSKDGTALNKFMAQITMDVNGKGKPTLEEVLEWKLKTKYFILLNSRILSLGNILMFELTFDEETKKPITQMYEEDLDQYNWDFSKGFPPKKGDKDYNPFTVQPYEKGKESHVEYTLSSKKKIRFEYLNGRGEKYLLGVDKNDASKNDPLIARNIEMDFSGKWQPIRSFNIFTSRDMMEIRTVVDRFDPEFDLFTYVKHPKTGDSIKLSIFNIGEFFYPKDYLTPITNQ